MANWAYVENGAVVEAHDLLPKNWRNISGLYLSADNLDFLKNLGWYKVTETAVDFNPRTHYISHNDYEVREHDVLEKPVVVAKS
jgi:hypothetical protein